MSVKFKCPFCNRRQEVTPNSDGKFQMPWHENYRKTETCEASEKTFRVATPGIPVESERIHRGPLLHSGSASAVLAMLALCSDHNSRRHRGIPMSRRRGNR